MQPTKAVSKHPIVSIPEKAKSEAPLKSLHVYEFVVPRLQNIVERPVAFEDRDISLAKKETLQLFGDFHSIQHALVTKYGPDVQNELSELSRFTQQSIALSREGCEAFRATLKIYAELIEQNYAPKAAMTYLHFATRLLLNHLQGGALGAAQKAQEVQKTLLANKHSASFEPDTDGNSNSYAIFDGEARAIRVKQSRQTPIEDAPVEIKRHDPYCYSSFLKSFPDMPLTTNVAEHELIGYELDAILGLDRTPLTFKATIGVDGQDPTPGSLQLYVPNAKSADSYLYDADQARKYATLDTCNAHLTALSGMIKGLTAHHWGNYLMQEQDGKIVDALEIDMEEIMPPFNKVPENVTPSIAYALVQEREELLKKVQTAETTQAIEALNKRIETMRKTYVLCRLFIIGLWQSKAAFDKALLMIITHPSMQKLLDGYHKNVLQKETSMHPDCLKAQKERLDLLQALSKAELEKPKVTASPRDFYFAIFGGKEIYDIAKTKGFPDVLAFNQIISDPYPGAYKDFADPTTLKTCTLLQPITDQDAEERKICKANLQEIEKFY